MAKEVNKVIQSIVCSLLAVSTSTMASNVQLTPRIGVEEVFSDNVTLDEFDEKNSWVTLLKPGINAQYFSAKNSISFDAEFTQAWYTHDHDLDDNYKKLSFESQWQLYPDGLFIVANARIDNVNQNDAQNALADLISSDTSEEREFDLGLRYGIYSNHMSLNSSVLFSKTTSDDNLGEREGYQANLSSRNGNLARNIFWDMSAGYQDFDNDNDFVGNSNRNRTGRYYSVDGKIGMITDYKINPFVRFYDEDNSGNLNQNKSLNSSSYGAGLRWYLTKKSYLDVAYNWVDDDDNEPQSEDLDDYVSTSIYWQPSNRVNLVAKYYKRFYDDAYEFKYTHKLKRFALNINYNEQVELFDRFELVDTAVVYCPKENQNSQDLTGCVYITDLPANHNLVPNNNFTDLLPGQTNDFVLNKSLNSTLSFKTKRSTYSISLDRKRRENLEIGDYDTNDRATINYSHQTTRQSTVEAEFSWRRNEFDHDNTETKMQRDHYRIYRLSLDQSIRESLTITYSLRHVNRNSTRFNGEYEENRASITLVKEF